MKLTTSGIGTLSSAALAGFCIHKNFHGGAVGLVIVMLIIAIFGALYD